MTNHPFTKGQKVRCVGGTGPRYRAVQTGEICTVKWTFVGYQPGTADGPIAGMQNTPGIGVEEYPRHCYRADRFEAVDEEE